MGDGKPKHVLISSIKDEGPFLLEWVAHHLVLGFDRICIASNDCRDGSDRLLAALDRAGHIAHVPNVLQAGDIPQHAGYDKIRATQGIDGAEWLMMLDADEFLNVHVGEGRVGDLIDRAESDVDVIALNGMFFTDAPGGNWQPGRVCAQFTAPVALRHKANAALKTLTRDPGRFRAIHNHSMVGFQGKGRLRVLWGDGTVRDLEKGVPMWKQLRNGPLRQISHRLAQYNHYGIKTWDSFQLRRDRGRGAVAEMVPEKARHTDAYFAERSVPEGQDHSIARYGAEVVALMQQMLLNDDIRACQEDCERLYGDLLAPYRR